ncbi:MAG TPA: arginine--tRNA ligase [Gemmataceae bacterium]|nr:arginine--tRNA ligase [Gemmataceae bacterium]
MGLLHLLQQKVHEALAGLVPDPAPFAALVRPAQDARFGDYQCNAAMPLAKQLGKKPRDVAAEIVQRLATEDMLELPEIAGPGFINLRFQSDWLAKQLQAVAADERLGIARAEPPRTIVIDFSSPNVAKPMHVGHLRSTIIGDALARLFRFLGHRVITDNHLGDWGTQFGMLLYGYKHFRDEEALRTDPVREMVRLYVKVRQMIDAKEDEEAENAANPIAEACRQETAKLHAGDPENVRLWQTFMPWCLEEIDRIYRRLDVHFDHTHGESFYNPRLPGVVQSLLERGIAEPGKEGSLIIRYGAEEPPAMVRKRDGAFTYTTSDLATIRYRMEQWQPDAILYVVDFRQSLHFKNLFEAARRWGCQRVALEHVSFGSVLGPDRKPIKTREGGAVELGDLLNEAVERAAQVYEQLRNERRERGEEVPELSADELRQVHEVVGLGAVKYADLSQNRESDYVFNWDKMLAMDGNTATYMQYAYVRNRGIFRKGNEDPAPFRRQPPLPSLEHAHERALALQLLRFDEALEAAAAERRPNLITNFLWDVAKTYSGFNQNCPVLRAETPALRQSRLLLCDVTARTIQQGLGLLGIGTIERM